MKTRVHKGRRFNKNLVVLTTSNYIIKHNLEFQFIQPSTNNSKIENNGEKYQIYRDIEVIGETITPKKRL